MERLAAGRAVAEADATAAVFRAWPGPPRLAARRLAAHANAARGRDVLWLVGAQPDGRAVPKQGPPVRSGMAGQARAVFRRPRAARHGFQRARSARGQVVALHIETTRAPFVDPARGNVCEVPWLDHGPARDPRGGTAGTDPAAQPAGRFAAVRGSRIRTDVLQKSACRAGFQGGLPLDARRLALRRCRARKAGW